MMDSGGGIDTLKMEMPRLPSLSPLNLTGRIKLEVLEGVLAGLIF
jgi:hypothetical protein